MKKIALYLCVFALITGVVSPNVWASKTETQQNKKEVDAKLDQTTSEYNQTLSQLNSARQEYEENEIKFQDAAQALDAILSELEITNEILSETEEELEQAQNDRDNQYESFKKRARYIYMNGTMSYLDVILSANSFSDLVKKIDYVNRIVEYDKNILSVLKETEETINVKLEEVQKTKDDLEVLELIGAESMHKYETALAEKIALIDELDNDAVEYLKNIEALQASSDQLAKQLKAIADAEAEEARKKAQAAQQTAAATQTYTFDGKSLQWPVPSRSYISSPYGSRIHPINGKQEMHTGIDIPASYGSNVIASESGTVVTSGWINGYGYTVIINHGGGLSTLYAHNSSLVAKVGASVSRGQVIAKIGSTGYSTGNHLHYEVRVNSAHTNPLKYTSP